MKLSLLRKFSALSVVVFPLFALAQPSWQYAVSASQNLCIRDKYGELGNYSAKFSVVDPETGDVYSRTIQVNGDDFACVDFPGDGEFTNQRGQSISSVNSKGVFRWKADVAGKTVLNGKFLMGREVL